jgi:hypothetical protein
MGISSNGRPGVVTSAPGRSMGSITVLVVVVTLDGEDQDPLRRRCIDFKRYFPVVRG